MRRTREQLRLASKSTAKLNKSERQVIKRFKQREAERQVIKRVKDAMQRKHKRKRIKMNAKAGHRGRTLALLALERLALAGLVQRTSVFVEDEMLRYSTRRTRTHLPVKAAETASQLYQNMPAVPLIDKAALICCVEYMRNSKKASLCRVLIPLPLTIAA